MRQKLNSKRTLALKRQLSPSGKERTRPSKLCMLSTQHEMSAAVASLNEVQQQQQQQQSSETNLPNAASSTGDNIPSCGAATMSAKDHSASDQSTVASSSLPKSKDNVLIQRGNSQSPFPSTIESGTNDTVDNSSTQSLDQTTRGTSHHSFNQHTAPSITTVMEEVGGGDTSSSSLLPAPLYRILKELAQNGESTVLTWNSTKKGAQDDEGATNKKRGLSVSGINATSAATTTSRGVASLMAASAVKSGGNGVPPPRKKHRNGLHSSSRSRNKRSSHHRKRSLQQLTRSGGSGTATATVTTTTTTTTSPTLLTPSGAVSGRFPTSTSGSEQEDTSHYDSEGTSATSTSELSFEQQHWQLRGRSQQQLHLRTINTSALRNANAARPGSGFSYSSLREALCTAVGIVLDHWFEQKGGYKLSPAEVKIYEGQSMSLKDIFLSRKRRIMARLEGSESDKNASDEFDGPPFTIQRLAEVLVHPGKYYTKTHKLLNCLEKLLLVSSTSTAFGGSRGGVTSQSRIEEQELAALADERDRIQSEFRLLRKRRSSLASDSGSSQGEQGISHVEVKSNYEVNKMDTDLTSKASSNNIQHEQGTHVKNNEEVISEQDNLADSEVAKATVGPADAERRELEAAARASLRSKFDHVGIDPHHHHGAALNANSKSVDDRRGMTSSPPPPTLTSAPNLSGGVLRSPHATHGDPSSPVQAHSPILFNESTSPGMSPHTMSNTNPNMHLLQMHHAAAVAGVSPLDLMTLNSNAAAASGANPPAGSAALTASLAGTREQDLESRSSASSDIDSESDDISFDDSASDRSDGSDSGYVASSTQAEVPIPGASNFSALAQAMALKRNQTRVAAAAILNTRSPKQITTTTTTTTTENVNHPAENQSTSTHVVAQASARSSDDAVPEDSDVSDSSLSDMAE